MEQTVSLRFTPSKSDYKKAVRAYLKRRPMTWIALAYFGLLILYLVCFLASAGEQVFSLVGLMAVVILGVLAYQWILVPLRLGYKVERHERLRSDTIWQMDNEEILVKNQYVE